MDVIGHIGRSISPRSPHSADTGTTQSMLKPLSLLHHYEHSYLELHGAFHRLVRARSAAPQQVWLTCWARSARNCFACCSRVGVARRNRPAEVGGGGPAVRRQGRNLIPSGGILPQILPNLVYLCCDHSTNSNVDCARPDTDIVDIEIPSHDLAPANRSVRRCGDLYRAQVLPCVGSKEACHQGRSHT